MISERKVFVGHSMLDSMIDKGKVLYKLTSIKVSSLGDIFLVGIWLSKVQYEAVITRLREMSLE